jgi:hypothetical protein
MNLTEVIQQLTQERMKIDAALRALGEVSGSPAQSVGPKKKKRTMSVAARKLISEAQKKRWAAQRRQAKRG